MKIADQIKAARGQMLQGALARAISRTPASLCRIETGEAEASIETLARIAKELGVEFALLPGGHIRVACPRCKAAPSEHCKTEKGKPTSPHGARLAAEAALANGGD